MSRPKVESRSLLNLIESVNNAKKLMFEDYNAEKYVAIFLELRQRFNQTYDDLRDTLTENGVEASGENFGGIQGNLVSGLYRAYGAKYEFNPRPGLELDPEMVKKEEKITYKVNTKAVDKYLKEYGELPEGITEAKNRTKSLSLKTTDEGEAFFAQKVQKNIDTNFVYSIPEKVKSDEKTETE